MSTATREAIAALCDPGWYTRHARDVLTRVFAGA
jgi:hypothetical protein